MKLILYVWELTKIHNRCVLFGLHVDGDLLKEQEQTWTKLPYSHWRNYRHFTFVQREYWKAESLQQSLQKTGLQ